MEHKGTISIETERLILRPFTIDDADKMYENWAQDEAVTRFLTWKPHENLEQTREIISLWVENYTNPEFYQWAITLKDNNEPIGSFSIVKLIENTSTLEVGYCMSAKFWGKRYMPEAFNAIIAFLFENVKAHRIQAKHDVNNPNSGKVMQKCGLKYEGTMRKADKNNQGIVDVSMYAILYEDYLNKKQI